MTFNEGAHFDSNRARSGGSGGRGGILAAGGGIGTVVLVGLFLLLGGSLSELGQLLGSQDQSQLPAGSEGTGEEFAHCQTAADGNKYDDCRVMFAAESVDQVWAQELPKQAGIEYTEPGLIIFHNTTTSGCGQASAATGPFYCPADESAYFDTAFFDQMRSFGAENAPLAQMYIVAHEFGHHIQQLEGTLGLSNYNQPGADSNAVKIELQADCYAGIWAHFADEEANGEAAKLETITDEQARTAIDTARAVGDDNIQRRSGGEVRPDQWTHGSSADRAEAFATGFNTGSMAQCDYLGRGVYS
ncbi:neutral zinc metallopeptidase [Corynebacterium sp.]|uniref:KPN_02809 family neutral zinc metallopeptidase n=1 Tax=Corynebacterium sp. TaxID=1720 RepID=UPI0026DC3875|nr:neutral zinc metallopeptidase [Corynebacterium sp.]MDO5031766.1 neutral zinc metallopeptidase [Corynebacterium sp.]